MCVNYALHKDLDKIAEYFKVDQIDIDLSFRSTNITFGSKAPILLYDNGKRVLKYGHFTLVPETILNEKEAQKMRYILYNARDDRLRETKNYSPLFGKQHCAIIMNLMFEKSDINNKWYKVEFSDKSLFAVPGLYSVNNHISKTPYLSFVPITVDANENVNKIYKKGRMLAVFEDDDEVEAHIKKYDDIEESRVATEKLLKTANNDTTIVKKTMAEKMHAGKENDDYIKEDPQITLF